MLDEYVGDWRLVGGLGTGNNIHITVGENESFLVDYFPKKPSDLIGIAVHSNVTKISLDPNELSKTEKIIHNSTITMSEQEMKDILESLRHIESFLKIINSSDN